MPLEHLLADRPILGEPPVNGRILLASVGRFTMGKYVIVMTHVCF